MKNPIFTKKILATGIILSLFSSYIPVSYVGPNSVVFANSGTSVNNEMSIEFLDINGSKIDENAIFDGKDGQNITFQVKVNFPENVTNKNVEIKLGNLLSFVDYGKNSEVLKEQTNLISNPVGEGNLVSNSGVPYKVMNSTNDYNYSINHKVTYTVKENVNFMTIPLTIRADQYARLKGFAEDGILNGNNEGVERTVPVLVTGNYTKNGEILSNEKKFGKISMTPILYPLSSYLDYTGILAKRYFSSDNGYEAIARFSIGGIGNTSSTRNFIEEQSIDIHIPANVQVLKYSSSDLIETNRVEDNTGTTITFTSKYPLNGRYSGTDLYLKLDRNIYTAGSVKLTMKNPQIKYRNYDKISVPTGNSSLGYAIRDFGENESIGFITPLSAYPYYGEILPKGNYHSLFYFGFLGTMENYRSVETRPKEMRMVFTENEFLKVKGFKLFTISEHNISQIFVKSKDFPDGKIIDLGKNYSYSNNETRGAYLDVVSLGLSEDDELREVVYNIGKLRPNHLVDGALATNGNVPNEYRSTSIFGEITKFSENGVNAGYIEIRDVDYDPNGTNNFLIKRDLNYYGTYGYSSDQIKVKTDSTKILEYSKTGILNYEVYSERENGNVHWQNSVSELSKVYLVLPKSLNVKDIRFKKDNIYFTSEILRSERIEGENKIYTFDFVNAEGLKKYIGWIGERGGKFKSHRFNVEVEVENDTKDILEFPYEKTLFIEPVRIKKGTSADTIRNDKYDVDGDGLTTTDTNIFTNIPTTNFLRLNVMDKIDLTSEAKLSTENTYTSANESFKIKNITENLDLKYKIENKLSKEVGNIDLYLPIPKKGQNFGTNFQTKAFDYGLKLLGKAKLSEGLEDIFDISYAEVDSTKLNGTRNLTISELEKENFQTNPNSFENINLMRIKTKAGVKIPAKSSYDLETSLELLNITEADDGKNISWKPYYSAIYDQYSKVENARDISVDISLGKLALEVYNDANTNGTKDTENPIDTEIELFDENGVKIANKRTTNGKVMFDGLVAGKKYKAFVINPDKNVYHFTSGTALADESKSSKEIVAELREENSLTVHNIGLSDVVSAIPVINTIKTNSTEITGTGIANAKIEVTLPNGTKKQTTVDTNGIWKVTLTDSEKTSLTVNSNVKVTQKENFKKLATANKVVEPTEAESNRLNLPVKTKVDNINTLTEDEKNKVKDEVKKANPTLNDDQITVDNLGNVTVRYPDNSTNTLTKELTVIQKTDSEKNSLNEPAKTKVDNLNNLTDDEKSKVKDEVKKANPSLNDDQISVDSQGNVTVTYADNSTKNLDKSKTVIQKTDSEKSTLNEPVKTKVDDINSLTEDEKNKVKDEVKKANPTLNLDQIFVDTQGNVTVTYADNSTKNLDKSKTVIQKTDSEKSTLNEPVKTKVDDINSLTEDEKNKVKDEVKKANPTLNLDQISVDSQGNVTVTYADNSTNTLTKELTVIAKTDSEKSTLNEPVKTKVDDINSLTEDEKNKVKDEVKKANPTLNLDQISVDSQGNVTVTYADNSTKNLDKSKTVIQKTDSEKSTLNEPVKTKVDDINSLTEDEKNKVKDEVKKANPTLNLDQISVDSQGNVTVTYADNSTKNLDRIETVYTIPEVEVTGEKVRKIGENFDLTLTPRNGNITEVLGLPNGLKFENNKITGKNENLGKYKITIKLSDGNKDSEFEFEIEVTDLLKPSKTLVDHHYNLTNDEKDKVKNEIIKVNPFLTKDQIEVQNNGNTIIKFSDGTTKELPPYETIIQKFLGSAPKPEDLVLKDDPRVNTIITSIIEKTKDIIEKISENKNKEEVELNSAPEKTENKEKTINGETRKYSLNKEDTACPMIPNIVGDFNKEFELTFKDMVSIQNLDEVQRLTKVDILNKKGVNNTDLFEPNRGITRAEFLAIVLKAHCYDISVKPDSLPFYDVDLDSWQAKVVKVGVEEGIIKGYEADEKGVSFRPNRPISKIESFAIMIKMREIKISDDIKDSYVDKKADWQKEPLATGEYLGILNPEKSNFKFYPDSILTRDEMVKYIVDIVRLY